MGGSSSSCRVASTRVAYPAEVPSVIELSLQGEGGNIVQLAFPAELAVEILALLKPNNIAQLALTSYIWWQLTEHPR